MTRQTRIRPCGCPDDRAHGAGCPEIARTPARPTGGPFPLCLGPIVARGMTRSDAYARADAERSRGMAATVDNIRGRYLVRAWEPGTTPCPVHGTRN